MAKQALRDFQNRLAERLQAARTQGVAASWLAVRAGAERLLVPLSHAAEIFPWTDMQRVPYVQPWFLGVANLRGNLCGVVDLAAFLHGGAAATRPALAQAQCRLIGFNALLESNCAVLVDELLGQQQVVVKNLERNYRRVPGISGATILGDGHVALIVDVGGLVRLRQQLPQAA